MNNESWTIRDVCRRCFSEQRFRIPVSTVKTWIQRGVFVPAYPAAPRDPRGSRVVRSDVTLLAVLGALFASGLHFDDLSTAKLQTDESEYPMSDLLMPHSIITFDKRPIASDQRGTLTTEITQRRRPIQTYFEMTRYNAVIIAHRYFGNWRAPMPPVAIWLTNTETLQRAPGGLVGLNSAHPMLRTLIEVRLYYNYVASRLRAVKT
jgi:hypothetical protein